MPYLGDFLGHILAEITIARMQADLEALRVADLYASHPLLRTMPIPRFRLPDFDIDLPILINEVEEAGENQSPRGGVDPTKVYTAFNTALAAQLRSHSIRTPVGVRNTIRSVIKRRIASLTYLKGINVDASRIANELTTTLLKTLQEKLKDVDREKLSSFAEDLRASTRLEILRTSQPPPRLNVRVLTSEIKEVSRPEDIVRLKLMIREDSLEWTMIDKDGETLERLIPE